ncbi:MAG: YbdK family carboxylate-amine ligase [Actinobacteria bacterium]|nr:MAG: YbdK family carboxylate-amine ligase [Actinomycetota bacterium]
MPDRDRPARRPEPPAFGSSEPFLVGLEEELLLVEASGERLAPVAAQVLEALQAPSGLAGHEAYAAEIELRSVPRASAVRAATQVGELRAAARAAGTELMGAGVHPTSPWGVADLVQLARYRDVERTMRGLIRRTPECALHVHVALPDPEAAISAYNGLREHLPLLVALAGNSPWWFGNDSGLASARHAQVRAYPRRGVPPALRDFDHYLELIDAVMRAGGLPDYTFVWWDVRPHPRLGTVEVREMDSQSRLVDVAALAALIQGLARHEAERRSAPRAPAEAIDESCFRAARDGLQAVVETPEGPLPVPAAARRALGLAGAALRGAGEEEALDGIERILREGAGADRQRAAHAQGGVGALLRQLVAETAAPL